MMSVKSSKLKLRKSRDLNGSITTLITATVSKTAIKKNLLAKNDQDLPRECSFSKENTKNGLTLLPDPAFSGMKRMVCLRMRRVGSILSKSSKNTLKGAVEIVLEGNQTRGSNLSTAVGTQKETHPEPHHQ